MLHFFKIIFLLGVLLFPLKLLSITCPNTSEALAAGKITLLKVNVQQLLACQQYKDSLALSYHEIGRLYYGADLDSAIHYTHKALTLRQELFEEKPTIDLGKSYHNLGFFYVKKENYKQAKLVLKEAIEVYKELDQSRMIWSCLELANVYESEGEYKIAADYYKLVITIGTEILDDENVGKALLNLGGVKLEEKKYEEASQYFKKAQPVLDRAGLYEEEGKCANNLGIAAYLSKKYSASIIYYQKAIRIFKELEYFDEVAKIQSNLGRSYQKNGNNKLAISTLKEAIAIANDYAYPDVIAASYDNLGEYFLEVNEPELALSEFQNAIRTLMPAFKFTTDYQNPTPESLINVSNKIDLLVYFSDKARALKSMLKLDSSKEVSDNILELYRLGDRLIDQLRQEHTNRSTKLFWREKVIPFYEAAIAFCSVSGAAKSAFFFFEKSKAILLLEAIQNSDALAIIPDTIQTTSFRLKKNLTAAREALEDATEENRSEQLKQLIEIQKEFDNHTQSLAVQFPELFSEKKGLSLPDISVFKMTQIKDEETASIHYFYGTQRIYGLLITQKRSVVFDLGAVKDIEPLIRTFLDFFTKSSNIENRPQVFIQQAYKLYTILVEPLEVENTKNILIFPDGALAYIPFEALTMTEVTHLAEVSYLIERHVFRYAYSAAILENQVSSIKNVKNSIAAFAPFASTSNDQGMIPLQYSDDELRQINTLVEGVFLKDESASKVNFLKLKDQCKVFHLSTHAFSSTVEQKPYVAFADTALFLSELYAMHLPADLVVLSACQTNIGQISPGEGVMSIGRGFTHAGAKSLVASLWNINANATGQILTDFYSLLQLEHSKHVALHKAKKQFLKNPDIPGYQRSPYYWAGLIYYGSDDTLILEKKINNYIFSFFNISILISFLIIVIYFLKRRRTN